MRSFVKNNQAVLALLLSLVSLGLVVFREFVQGPKLTSQLTQINLMRLGDGAKPQLLVEMLAADLVADAPSASARSVMAAHPDLIRPGADVGRVKLAIQDLARVTHIEYNPPRAVVEQYFGHRLFWPSFYIPILVSNSGAQVGYVSSLVLVAKSAADPAKKWAFPAWVEVNVPVLLDRSRPHTDVERTKTIFSGIAVPPRGSSQVDLLFLPQHDASNTIISRENLPPGDYQFTVFGYSPAGRLLFKTQGVDYALKAERLFEMFQGADSVDFVLIEKHIADAIGR